MMRKSLWALALLICLLLPATVARASEAAGSAARVSFDPGGEALPMVSIRQYVDTAAVTEATMAFVHSGIPDAMIDQLDWFSWEVVKYDDGHAQATAEILTLHGEEIRLVQFTELGDDGQWTTAFGTDDGSITPEAIIARLKPAQ